MDTSLSLPAPAAAVQNPTAIVPRAITTKVQAVKSADRSATLPADKPFVAQVVTARLSGAPYPENPAEIAPPERTLRPYDVPMLPYDDGKTGEQTSLMGVQTQSVEPTDTGA